MQINTFCPKLIIMISTRSSAEPSHLLYFLRLLAGNPLKLINADSLILPEISRFPINLRRFTHFAPNKNQMISTRSSAEPMHLLHFLRLLAGTPSKQISADSHILPKNNNQMISTRSYAEPMHLLHFLRLLAGIPSKK